jgi:hypothetical protein
MGHFAAHHRREHRSRLASIGQNSWPAIDGAMAVDGRRNRGIPRRKLRIDARLRNQTRAIRFISAGAKNLQIEMTQRIAGDEGRDEPATLHSTIQLMLGERLRAYYRRPKKLSHELFVLMMQMKEQERRHANAVAAALKSNLKPKAVES